MDLQLLYSDSEKFRQRIDMARYRFGRGEYQYFANPLPELVAQLREELYACLYQTANAWMSALGTKVTFPANLRAFSTNVEHGTGSTNSPASALSSRRFQLSASRHLRGSRFPFQVIVALSDPTSDFKGGELLLIEQRPRAQSRGHALTLACGEAVVISTRFRPIKGARGYYRATLRHGVSTVLRGSGLRSASFPRLQVGEDMLDEDVCWQAVRSKNSFSDGKFFLWSCDYWRLLPPFMPIAFATAQERSLLRESESGRERWASPVSEMQAACDDWPRSW